MAVSAGMIAHLQSNCTFLCEVWVIAASSGAQAAYASHTRDLFFDSRTYKATPIEPARMNRKLGLEPDTTELTGALDDQITEVDIAAGKWRMARIQRDIVCYTDLSLGPVQKTLGYAGQFTVRNGLFTVEFQSISQMLDQEIGDLTSPTDRARTLAETGVNVASFTHAGTVTAVTDRRRFTVSVVQANDYFRYGKITFTSGANNGRSMEIKLNTAGALELQLPMPSAVANGDGVSLIRGYDGTRAAAKALGSAAVLNYSGEPDLPGMRGVLQFPT